MIITGPEIMKNRTTTRFIELGRELEDRDIQEAKVIPPEKAIVNRVGKIDYELPKEHQIDYRFITRFAGTNESKQRFTSLIKDAEDKAYAKARYMVTQKLIDLRRWHKDNEKINKELGHLIDSIRPNRN